MNLASRCTRCRRVFGHLDNMLGRPVRCPACKEETQVPALKRVAEMQCECGKSLALDVGTVGQTVRCPGCGAEWQSMVEDFIDTSHPAYVPPPGEDLLAQAARQMSGGAAPPAADPADYERARVAASIAARKAGMRDVIIGGLVCAVGTIITIGSYAAASSPTGGRYVIAWGAIVFGGIQFFRGLIRLTSGR